MKDPIHTFLSYIKTKQVMNFRLKPMAAKNYHDKWVGISDKEIEKRFFIYKDGFVRADVLDQLEMEEVIIKKKIIPKHGRPYNAYQLQPSYFDYAEFDIDLIEIPPPPSPMHQAMIDHLSRVMIDIDSYADVLTTEYLEYFRQFLQYRQSDYINRFVTVCKFANRVHTPITNLKREVRPNIHLDYEPTTGLDVAQMQPTILGKVLQQYCPNNSFSEAINKGVDIYIHLQQQAQKSTRDEGKKLFFKLAFGYPDDNLLKYFPDGSKWVDWINRLKRKVNDKNPHGDRPHTNLAWLLQTTEVKVMREAWEMHIAAGIPFLTVHDEIIVKQSDALRSAEIMRKVLDDEFEYYKLNTKT